MDRERLDGYKPDGDQTLAPVERPVEVGGKKYNFLVYNIGKTPEGALPSPGEMNTGGDQTRQLLDIWGAKSISEYFDGYPALPYSFLTTGLPIKNWGDFSNPAGQNMWADTDLQFTDLDGFTADPEVNPFWEYARLAAKKTFRVNERVLSLRGVEYRKGKMLAKIGPGWYSDSFYTNGMGGTMIVRPTAEQLGRLQGEEAARLQQLYEELAGLGYEGKSIREIVAAKFRGLPEINARTHNHSIGVATTVLTQDGYIAFVQRGKNVSVNKGVNCTASGAAKWDQGLLSEVGLPRYLGQELHREVDGELGLSAGEILLGAINDRIERELGLEPGSYCSSQVGLIAELPREGKPEAMFLTVFNGDSQELVRKIDANPNAEKGEIEEEVWLIRAEECFGLNRVDAPNHPVQHKGRVNLVMIEQAIKNSPALQALLAKSSAA